MVSLEPSLGLLPATKEGNLEKPGQETVPIHRIRITQCEIAGGSVLRSNQCHQEAKNAQQNSADHHPKNAMR